MKKELVIIFLLLAISSGLVFQYFFGPKNTLKYNGIQIYDAIRKYNLLFSRGFDINVTVIGKDYSGDIELSGIISEVKEGFFVLQVNETSYRIVEGPMGVEDVQAKEIYFYVSKPMVVEIIIPPVKDYDEFSKLLKEYEKIKGGFAVLTLRKMTPVIIQKIRNMEKTFCGISKLEVEEYDDGFIVKIPDPMNTAKLLEILKLVNSDLYIESFESGYVYMYKGVENEQEVFNIKEKSIGLVRTYRI